MVAHPQRGLQSGPREEHDHHHDQHRRRAWTAAAEAETPQGRPTPATPTAATTGSGPDSPKMCAKSRMEDRTHQCQEQQQGMTTAEKRRPRRWRRRRKRKRGRRSTTWRWHTTTGRPRNSGSTPATYSTRTCACRKQCGSPGETARRRRRRRRSSTATSRRCKTSVHRVRTRQRTGPRRRTVWSTWPRKTSTAHSPSCCRDDERTRRGTTWRRRKTTTTTTQSFHERSRRRNGSQPSERTRQTRQQQGATPATTWTRGTTCHTGNRVATAQKTLPGDGNCLFHALTTAAGWGETAAQMRRRVVHYAVAQQQRRVERAAHRSTHAGRAHGGAKTLQPARRCGGQRHTLPLLRGAHEYGQSLRHHP